MSVTTTATTYLNVLPLSAQHTDMFELFREDDAQALPYLIQQFLSGKAWETDIHAAEAQTAQLQHYYVTSKNVQKTLGTPILALGFPNILCQTPQGQALRAPLFLRYMVVKPHPLRPNSWLLGSDEHQSLHVNQYVLRALKTHFGTDFEALIQSFLDKKQPTDDDLLAVCQDMATALGFEATPITKALQPVPNATLLSELTGLGSFLRTGVLGLFPPQEGHLEAQMALETAAEWPWDTDHLHEYTILDEDVPQRAALRAIMRQKYSLVVGAHGTGKTHLATNLALNQASNGLKTAIIAKDMATLKHIQSQLVAQGLGHLCFLLKDLSADKTVFVDSLRHEAAAKMPEAQPADFNIALKQTRRLLAQSDETHTALMRPIFDHYNFTDVVGLYLQSQARAGRELLANHLSPKEYRFDAAEYHQLLAVIAESERLFEPIQTLRHPLSILHPTPFLTQNQATAAAFFEQNLQEFATAVKDLHHEYIAVYDAYAQKLLHHYEAHHEALRHQLRQIKEAFSDYSFQYGADYAESGLLKMGSLYATALFSDKSKNILSAKDETLQQYGLLADIHQEKRFFSHTFLPLSERKDLNKVKINLEAFELALRGWRTALSGTVQEELQRLNSKTAAFFDPPLAEVLLDLEKKLDQLLDDLNAVTIYAEPQGHKMLTIPKKMLFLESLTEKIAETQLNMRDFEAFYAWQRAYLSTSEQGQKLVQALVKVKPQNWTAAFESWYFHNILINHYQSDTLQNDQLMVEMVAAENRLRLMMPTQISALWYARKKAALRLLKDQNSRLYKTLTTAKADLSTVTVSGLFHQIGSILTEIYPILLTTPHVATQIIEGEGREFDWIIVDNAQQVEAATLAALQKNTAGLVALTETLDCAAAAFLQTQGVPTHRLNYVHRPQSAPILKLNQHVFYGSLHTPVGAKAQQQLSVQQVEPLDLPPKGINPAEIRAIIQYLETFITSKNQTHSPIAIVCTTIAQRDALTIALLQLVQRKDQNWEKWAHLQRHHLDIFHTSEISGQTFDHLIVSGVHTELGNFEMPMADFRALANSFRTTLHWFNSIPITDLEAAEKNTTFQSLLAQLLLMTMAYDNTNSRSDTAAWSELSVRFATGKAPSASPFLVQIAEKLDTAGLPYRLVQPFEWHNQWFEGAIVPNDAAGKTWLLRIDGRFYTDTDCFNAVWENRLLQEAQKAGLGILNLWSPLWWRQEAAAFDQILATLQPPPPEPIEAETAVE